MKEIFVSDYSDKSLFRFLFYYSIRFPYPVSPRFFYTVGFFSSLNFFIRIFQKCLQKADKKDNCLDETSFYSR